MRDSRARGASADFFRACFGHHGTRTEEGETARGAQGFKLRACVSCRRRAEMGGSASRRRDPTLARLSQSRAAAFDAASTGLLDALNSEKALGERGGGCNSETRASLAFFRRRTFEENLEENFDENLEENLDEHFEEHFEEPLEDTRDECLVGGLDPRRLSESEAEEPEETNPPDSFSASRATILSISAFFSSSLLTKHSSSFLKAQISSLRFQTIAFCSASESLSCLCRSSSTTTACVASLTRDRSPPESLSGPLTFFLEIR